MLLCGEYMQSKHLCASILIHLFKKKKNHRKQYLAQKRIIVNTTTLSVNCSDKYFSSLASPDSRSILIGRVRAASFSITYRTPEPPIPESVPITVTIKDIQSDARSKPVDETRLGVNQIRTAAESIFL